MLSQMYRCALGIAKLTYVFVIACKAYLKSLANSKFIFSSKNSKLNLLANIREKNTYRVSPLYPWKRFRYPSVMRFGGQERIVFYSNWKGQWDLYSAALNKNKLKNIRQLTFDGNNYGPKIYYSQESTKYFLIWHRVEESKGTVCRKILISESLNFINWSKPLIFGEKQDNCYPSLIFYNDTPYVVYSAGQGLYQKNKALYLCSLDNPQELIGINTGEFSNAWRSDVAQCQQRFYCAFENPEGIVVMQSEDLEKWMHSASFKGSFQRPRLSLSQDKKTLYLCFELSNQTSGTQDLCFTTLTPDNGRKIVQITDDEFDNSRPGPLMQIKSNKFKVFYTSNCMGLNSLSCVEFIWNSN
jgi:hypothetical protein